MPQFNRGKYAYRVEEVREEFLEKNDVVSARHVHVCNSCWSKHMQQGQQGAAWPNPFLTDVAA